MMNARRYLTNIWRQTNQPNAPWYLIDSTDKKWAELQMTELLLSGIDTALMNIKGSYLLLQNTFPVKPMPNLADISLDKKLTDEEYKKELEGFRIDLRSYIMRYIEEDSGYYRL